MGGDNSKFDDIFELQRKCATGDGERSGFKRIPRFVDIDTM